MALFPIMNINDAHRLTPVDICNSRQTSCLHAGDHEAGGPWQPQTLSLTCHIDLVAYCTQRHSRQEEKSKVFVSSSMGEPGRRRHEPGSARLNYRGSTANFKSPTTALRTPMTETLRIVLYAQRNLTTVSPAVTMPFINVRQSS